jgi:4a-hydroxytetrahydrobiopterin dehydratase
MAVRTLTEEEIAHALLGIDGWTLLNGKLHREFRFTDFSSAFAFMTRAALLSERMNHHPEWCNVYDVVRINLLTHEVDGITERDLAWARSANRLVQD